MAKYSGDKALIDILNLNGVDKIYLNPGAESVSLLSEVASARLRKEKAPQLVLCLDESVAAAAAYGNYMVTRKPQVVIVHSEIGTTQLGANIQNLQWGRVPAVIISGYWENEQERVLWNGEPFDQGSIVRNSMKYDRYLTGEEDIHEVLNDAFSKACSEPTGPVYLCVPMGYLSQEFEKPQKLPTLEITPLPEVDMSKLEEMADILLNAKYPMLISGNAGRYPENVDALVSLAETLSMPVLTGYSWMNFPSNHPLCIGVEQIGGSRKMDAGYEEADVILAIDYAMPYIGSSKPPKKDAKILHIDVDHLTQGRVLWNRGADIFMKADSRLAISALEKLLKEKITASMQKEIDARFEQLSVQNEAIRQGWYSAAQNQADNDPISPNYLCYCLNQLIDQDTLFVNHTLSYCASSTEQIVREKPGTWFSCPSGSICWANGAALGAASAAPEKTVVTIMSDGGFVWGCPSSTFWTAAKYKFPFLAVVCNNSGYGIVRDVQMDMMGVEKLEDDFLSESASDFSLDYAKIAEAAGGCGFTVTKPEEIIPALNDAMAAVRSGKPALLDVHLSSVK